MKVIVPFFLMIFAVSLNMHAQDLTDIDFTVSEAPEWTKLFSRSAGWFGGDGIYTIPLNGKESSPPRAKKTLFIFSDTMVGDITNRKLEQGAKMIHNSLATLEGTEARADRLNFFWKGAEKPEPVFTPQTALTKAADYYWLGDGFVNQELNNTLFIFGYRVKNTSAAAFGFAEVGNTLLKVKANEPLPFEHYEQKDTPFYLDNKNGETGSFGAGVFVNTKKAGQINSDG